LLQKNVEARLAKKALRALVCLTIITITACQGNDPDSFTVNVEALPKPNQYQSHLKWNVKDDEGDHWIIQRQTDGKDTITVATVSHDTREYVDTSVVAGTTYHYGLASDESDALTVKKSLDVTVPKDISVNGSTALSSANGIGRLIIPKGSKIYTNGKDIEMFVEQIISDGGSIETFPEGQTAAANTAGRSGGVLKIHARTGSGSLTVVARGENGGPSTTSGAPGAPGLNGIPGNNANCGFKDNDAACGAEPAEYQKIVQKCKDGGLMGDLYCKILERFYCKMQAGNGGQGGQGYQGGRGGQGANGGDSGNILVEVTDPSNITIAPMSIEGAGGLGGPGGPGGLGGQGGAPGQQDRLHICTGVAGWGNPGPTGPVGQLGPEGSSGNKGPVCLRLGANASGDCSKF
jgi:hypothetical protein